MASLDGQTMISVFALTVAAVLLAYDKEGWGWFIFIAFFALSCGQ